jgi:uncharacterized protein YecT (DUF1311 family)
MRIVILSVALLAAAAVRAEEPPAEPTFEEVCAEGDTGIQPAMNECERRKLEQAELEMATVLAQIGEAYADEKLFLDKLLVAQQRWADWRDAELEAKFPLAEGEDPARVYGSIFPMVWSQHQAELTRQRTIQLRVWLDGIEEGDVAAGSVHTKED